jgi:hypothetical protein
MTTYNSYKFDNLSRIGNDLCGINARDLQNNSFGSYITTNYFLGSSNSTVNFATKQPNVFFKGGNGTCCAGGDNIGVDSKMKLGSEQINKRCKLNLQQRPFMTVPFLGRGPAQPDMESRIVQGSSVNDTKSNKTITELSFNNHSITPLIPEIEETIQNPEYLVESSAAEGWIRGGLPSREISKKKDYNIRVSR